MRFSVLFFAASAVTTALAGSYYETRSPNTVDNVYSELEARADIDSDAEVIAHFLRSLDEEELEYVFRRGFKQKVKSAGSKIGHAGSKAKQLAKGAVSRLSPFKFKNQVKPVDKATKKNQKKLRGKKPGRKLSKYQ